MRIKDVVLKTLTLPGATIPFAKLLQNRATILMLHRFRDRDHAADGMDPAILETGLAYLRRHRYELLSLEELFRRLVGGEPPLCRAVAFTLDDGYLEQATIAAPIFARYDCPATTFVTTGFVEGKIWFWWDQAEHVFRETARREVSVEAEGGGVRFRWEDDAGRRRAQAGFIAWCLSMPDAVMRAGVSALGGSAEVVIPAAPPRRYRAMSWDQLRQCEKLGMTFGPHTVTHPILSQTSAERSRREIEGSWVRLCEEAKAPVPVFCYPNGGLEDFGLREVAVLEELGFLGALVGAPGYADARTFGRDRQRFQVRRFGYPGDLPRLIQLVSGVERLKQVLRRDAAA